MAEYIEREAALRVLCDACGNAACPKGLIPKCSYGERMQSIPAAKGKADAEAYMLHCGDTDEPHTNADRIRAMTDEELAELWWERVDCGECPAHKECRLTGQDCKRLALDWLRQEAI